MMGRVKGEWAGERGSLETTQVPRCEAFAVFSKLLYVPIVPLTLLTNFWAPRALMFSESSSESTPATWASHLPNVQGIQTGHSVLGKGEKPRRSYNRWGNRVH